MPPITLLSQQIRADFPSYTFKQGDTFRWSPVEATIYHLPLEQLEDIWSLLHEVAHGELGHTTYILDVELVNHEAQAWKHAAATLAPRYGIVIPETYLQDHLDTYRYWLHQRSTCPTCGCTGVQTKNTYSCINCKCLWRANEARLCALRRIKLQGQSRSF